MTMHPDILRLDCEAETERICAFIREQVRLMKRSGAVIGLSGGIDSALCATLCLQALGSERVLGLILPEKESNPVSADYAAKHAARLGMKTESVDITPVLEAFGTYRKRDEAIATLFPDYDDRWRSKMVLPGSLLDRDAFNVFSLKVQDPEGNVKSARLDNRLMRRIVAATDTKQRTRMMHLYYYAERENYLVCGTTNRTETVQGFFVKYGDGGVDIEPIAHLYKTQVYELARHLGVIDEILNRVPSPDTFSFTVTDEEFYFRIPFDRLDLLMYAWEHGIDICEVAQSMGLSEEQVKRAFRDFTSKRNATKHLGEPPPTVDSLT